MGDRYFITGAQIGTLKALSILIAEGKEEDSPLIPREIAKHIYSLLEEIEGKQFICTREQLETLIELGKEKGII